MYTSSIVIAALLIAPQTLAELSTLNDVSSAKRAPMGFQGMRGKKDAQAALENEEFSKRALMGFQGMRGKKDSVDQDQMENVISEEYEKHSPIDFEVKQDMKQQFIEPDFDDFFYHGEYDKRAPMGFQGMRGKKSMIDEDYYKRGLVGYQSDIIEEIAKRLNMDFHPEDYQKRMQSVGFQGIHGTRNEYEGERWEKRAPMGFQGMRGKKSLLEKLEELKKRAMMGFQGMRGKKDLLNGYYSGYVVDPAEYEKRAPMGFQGMRGKKDGDKRASMGFVGMRGKRDVVDVYGNSNAYQENLPLNIQDSRLINEAIQFEKRSLRGYSGTRGKKIPAWEMRGKFIGVRGKKWTPIVRNTVNPMNNDFGNIERIGLKSDSTMKFDNQ